VSAETHALLHVDEQLYLVDTRHPMHPAITYSLLAVAALVVVGSFVLESKRFAPRFPRLAKSAWALQLGALALGYLVVRPGRGDSAESMAAKLASREPVLLDFYSNY
jgi:hypothetical protein